MEWWTKLFHRRTSEVEWLRARVEALEANLLALKKEGYTYSPDVPYEPLESDLDDAVQNAIRVMAGRNDQLAADLREWAEAQVILGETPEHVADRIYTGVELA